MIQFDTDALIALPNLIREGHPAIERIAGGEPASACVAVWYEYLIGPLETVEQNLAFQFLGSDIFALETEDATLAALLFNRAGRKRGLKTDALIAAAAIRRDAELFTLNEKDFRPFTEQGLRLLKTA